MVCDQLDLCWALQKGTKKVTVVDRAEFLLRLHLFMNVSRCSSPRLRCPVALMDETVPTVLTADVLRDYSSNAALRSPESRP
eukprot:COSAG02_NODE_2478_length_8730_cov_2.636079_3_plen_82_part_00